MINVVLSESSEPTFLEQIGPVLGIATGLLALVGVWVGKVWERRTGTQSWLRDRRMDVYAQFIQAAHKTWRAMSDVWIDTDPARSQEIIDTWRDRINELGLVESQIELLGPDEVSDAAATVQESHALLGKRIEDDLNSIELRVARRTTPMADSPEGDAAQKALDVFVKVASQALK